MRNVPLFVHCTQDGQLDIQELANALLACEVKLTTPQLRVFRDDVDVNGDGLV